MPESTVEIFRTNIKSKRVARQIVTQLNTLFPSFRINFDLSDCDRILRVEGYDYPASRIVETLTGMGYYCERMD